MNKLLLLGLILASTVPGAATSTVSVDFRPYCEKVREFAGVLFLGEVTSIELAYQPVTQTTGLTRLRLSFSVKQAYKRVQTRSVTIESESLSRECDKEWQQHEVYLVQATRDPDGKLRMVEKLGGDDDLARFFHLVATEPTGGATVFGRVTSEDDALKKGARIEVILEGTPNDRIGKARRLVRRTKVDSGGWYAFTGLPPGDYKWKLKIPKSLVPVKTRSFDLDINGCSQMNVRLFAQDAVSNTRAGLPAVRH